MAKTPRCDADGFGEIEMPMRRVLLAGLLAMGVVALLSAIWRGFAGLVFGVFVVMLARAALAATVLGVRWLRGEVAAQRELGGMAPVEAPWAVGPEPGVPSVVQLRETACRPRSWPGVLTTALASALIGVAPAAAVVRESDD